METKVCRRCGRERPKDEFGVDSNTLRRNAECRDCQNERQRERRRPTAKAWYLDDRMSTWKTVRKKVDNPFVI